mgnify:CR=1 FL=1
MERQCVWQRLSSTLRGLTLAAVGIGLVGCHPDADPEASPPGRPAVRAVAQQLEDDCIDFQGLRHCAAGAAKLVPHQEGALLEVVGGADPGKDGIAIALPEVTSYTPTGRINGKADDAAFSVRAMAGGKTIGTMNMARTPTGYRVSAAFTGDDSAGAYNVNLYYRDQLVGQLANRPVGSTVDLPYYRFWWWDWWWWWWWPSFWNVERGPHVGSCVWSMPLAQGDEVLVTADSGKPVLADRFELEEVVSKAGSYPYLSFDRIEYTSNSAMLLESENLENTH